MDLLTLFMGEEIDFSYSRDSTVRILKSLSSELSQLGITSEVSDLFSAPILKTSSGKALAILHNFESFEGRAVRLKREIGLSESLSLGDRFSLVRRPAQILTQLLSAERN